MIQLHGQFIKSYNLLRLAFVLIVKNFDVLHQLFKIIKEKNQSHVETRVATRIQLLKMQLLQSTDGIYRYRRHIWRRRNR